MNGDRAEIRNERDLIQVAPKGFEQYRDFALTSLTAYTLYWLHKWQLPRTIEAIAILNWRLFPEKFAMVNFAEFPDAFRTNRSLLQMQPKYRNLLTGAATKGFSLNSKGMDIAEDLSSRLGPPTKVDGQALGQSVRRKPNDVNRGAPRSIEPERQVRKLKESKLFEKWKNGAMTERDLIHVHTLLGIFDHTPSAVRRRAMKDIERSVQSVGDGEAEKFLNDVRKIFPQVLTD